MARDANDWTAASRSLANAAYEVGDVTRGREAFERALTAFDRFPTANKGYVARTNADTELIWAQTELVAPQCDEVQPHVVNADKLSKSADSLGARDARFNDQLTAIRKAIADRCG